MGKKTAKHPSHDQILAYIRDEASKSSERRMRGHIPRCKQCLSDYHYTYAGREGGLASARNAARDRHKAKQPASRKRTRRRPR